MLKKLVDVDPSTMADKQTVEDNAKANQAEDDAKKLNPLTPAALEEVLNMILFGDDKPKSEGDTAKELAPQPAEDEPVDDDHPEVLVDDALLKNASVFRASQAALCTDIEANGGDSP